MLNDEPFETEKHFRKFKIQLRLKAFQVNSYIRLGWSITVTVKQIIQCNCISDLPQWMSIKAMDTSQNNL